MTTFKQFLITEIKNSNNVKPGEVSDKDPKNEFQANTEMVPDKDKLKVLDPKNLSPAERERAAARKKEKGAIGWVVSKIFGKKS
jgi:hypothetical protein